MHLDAKTKQPTTPVENLLPCQLLEQSTALDSSNAKILTKLGYAYLQYAGLVGGASGYDEKAEKTLLRAYSLNDTSLHTIYYLGSLYAKTGRSKSAVLLIIRVCN